MRERVILKSPVREYCTLGSVRGAPGNRCPYLDKLEIRNKNQSIKDQGSKPGEPNRTGGFGGHLHEELSYIKVAIFSLRSSGLSAKWLEMADSA